MTFVKVMARMTTYHDPVPIHLKAGTIDGKCLHVAYTRDLPVRWECPDIAVSAARAEEASRILEIVLRHLHDKSLRLINASQTIEIDGLPILWSCPVSIFHLRQVLPDLVTASRGTPPQALEIQPLRSRPEPGTRPDIDAPGSIADLARDAAPAG
mgnify:CR=1 FL=1